MSNTDSWFFVFCAYVLYWFVVVWVVLETIVEWILWPFKKLFGRLKK